MQDPPLHSAVELYLAGFPSGTFRITEKLGVHGQPSLHDSYRMHLQLRRLAMPYDVFVAHAVGV